MLAAASASTYDFRFSRRMPSEMSVSCAICVVNLSSSQTIGISVASRKAEINRSVFSVCNAVLPSKLTGNPQTIVVAPFSFASAISAATSSLNAFR